jgi:hypothetical protein
MLNRTSLLFAGMAALVSAASTPDLALGQTCRTRSDFDITVTDAALQFERRTAPAQRIEMRSGALAVNQLPVKLGADDRKRVAAMETRARELVPKIKTIGQRGVDLMVSAIREEAARSSPAAAARPELNQRLDARAQELKRRIADSTTSKEWRPEAMRNYMAGTLADVVPLITGDLAQKALDLTLKGDLGGVIALKDQAAALHDSLEKRIQSKLDLLQPDIQKLCPSLRELDRLESAVTQPLPDGSHLNLLKVES